MTLWRSNGPCGIPECTQSEAFNQGLAALIVQSKSGIDMEDAFILHLHSCQTHLTSILAREPSAIGGITGTMPNRCGDRRLSLGAVVPFGLCSAEQVSSVALDASRSGARSLTLLAARFGAGETEPRPTVTVPGLLVETEGFWGGVNDDVRY